MQGGPPADKELSTAEEKSWMLPGSCAAQYPSAEVSDLSAREGKDGEGSVPALPQTR